MPEQHTIILFLIDNTGVPGVESENYLCSLIESPQIRSFSPAEVTHDNKGFRRRIIGLISEGVDNEDKLKKVIGRRIWKYLGLGKVFTHIKTNRQDAEVKFL